MNHEERPQSRVTREIPFFSCNPNGDSLFTVRAGLPLEDALNEASCFLGAAQGVVSDAAMDLSGPEHPESRDIFAALYLVQFAKALVDAAIKAAINDRRTLTDAYQAAGHGQGGAQ